MPIYEGLMDASNRMFSAGKFIDFFVHDILDYTVLNKKESNFTPDLKVFNIKDSIKEILTI